MEPNYAPNVQNQTVDFGGFRWKGNPGQGWSKAGVTGQQGSDNAGYTGGAPGNTQDPMALTQALQKFQVEANQPAVKTLTTQKDSLGDQYKKLLDDVTGAQSAETTYATRAANTSLGQRGIDPNSVEGQQQFAQVLDPISKSFGGIRASIGQGQISDTNTLVNAIAALQRGEPATSITGAGQFAGLSQQASLLPSQIALQSGQAQQARYLPIPNVGIYDLQSGKIISSTGLGASGRTIIGQY